MEYLGCKPCRGAFGSECIKQPLERIVSDLDDLAEDAELQQLNLRISVDGMHVKPNPLQQLDDLSLNGASYTAPTGIDEEEDRCHSPEPIDSNPVPQLQENLIPIKYISYGVRDTKYDRVFVMLVVKKMSSRSAESECHAFACNKSSVASDLATALGRAFKQYAEKVKSTEEKSPMVVDVSKDRHEAAYDA